ncbi:MAG: PHP domain-containing protein [Clostridia bacterium]|nr:PHP domain-containing protein [Clostridia bacterium]
MSADLHCHTRLSDGSMGIEDLIALAKKRGVDTLSITDHDCLVACRRAKVIGDRVGVEVLHGVELSACDEKTGRPVHILGYMCDNPDSLEGLCHQNTALAAKAGNYMIVGASKKYPVTKDLIRRCAQGSNHVCKQHVMQALIESGVTDSFYSDVYATLFSPDSPDCVLPKITYPDVKAVTTAVHDAQGVAILAHPALYDSFGLLENYGEYGFDGVEVWHPTADAETTARLESFAREHDLLMTGGSDFHGMYSRSLISPGDYTTPEQELEKLYAFKAKQRKNAK